MSVANVFEPEFDSEADREGFSYRRARIGWQAGTERLGASLYEVEPGQTIFPFHWHHSNEEMMIVLSGRPSVRTPEGWREVAEGEVVAFRAGPEGAHQISNWSDEPVRFLLVSEMNVPDLAGYPDSGKLGIAGRPPGGRDDPDEVFGWFRREDEVDYWEGEPKPERPDGD
jgi:uncharacterized cupin superfamily protein